MPKTILVVDDDRSVLALMRSVLEQEGLAVLSEDDPVAALERYKEDHTKIDLLITDLVMPTMSGTDLASKVLEDNPELPVLFVSGYEGESHDSSRKWPNGRFLRKPFRVTDLADLVRTMTTP